MVYVALGLASLAFLLALFALRTSLGATARLDRTEAEANRASGSADEAHERTRRLEQLVTRMAAGEAVAPEMIEEGRLYEEINAAQAKTLIEEEQPEDLFVLDVRSRGEVESGRIASATWIPVDEVEERLSEIPSSKHVVVFCAQGGRSAAACDLLGARGYRKLTNVVGGMSSYRGETVTGAP